MGAQAGEAVLDLTGDDDAEMRRKKVVMRWDNKSKKYVRVGDNDKKKIKTESGAYISATYKTNRYAKWKERSKMARQMKMRTQLAMAVLKSVSWVDCLKTTLP